MPTLISNTTDRILDLDTHQRLHWIIGRSEECDISLPDAGVSRFHATVFRLKNEYFLIDHSLNGTHIVAPAESLSSSTRVPSISRNDLPTREIDKANYHQDTAEIDAVIFGAPDTKAWDKFSDLNKSHAAFKVEQLSSRLPQVVGYSPHTLAQMGDLQPLLEMVYSSDDALHLTSMGRLLHSGSQIVIIGKEHHHLTYNA